MNVAGPSRATPPGRRAPRGNVESTYEDDLMGLLSQLSIDERDEIQSFFVQRARDGDPLSDHDVAMNDLLQQARALAVFNEDRALAQRIASGEDVQIPGALPRPNGESRTADGNRQHGTTRNDTPQTWGAWLSSMVGWALGAKPDPGPGSVAVPRNPVVNRPTGHDCVICRDPIYGAQVCAPCGHYYDVGCITDLFQSATKDETLYPPRCCRQNIPLAQVQPHLSQTLLATFQSKHVEFTTLQRVYCSSPTCSRFLGPVLEGIFSSKVYACPAPGCGRRTCGRCREQHSGDWLHICRPDADARQVLALGRASGWTRCPGCSQMIELHLGCFHMTCRCRTEFCYLCRARWKTCRCPQWDERRLLVVAEERVDAQLGAAQGARRDVPPPPPPAGRPVPVRQAPRVNRVVVPAPAPTVPARAPTVGAASGSTATANAAARPWAQLVRRPDQRTAHAATVPAAAPARTVRAASSAGKASRPRKPAPDAGIDTARQQMVREMMERLRVNHNCVHTLWHYRKGGGRCQSCGHHLPRYLLRCEDCEAVVCNRCSRNRL